MPAVKMVAARVGPNFQGALLVNEGYSAPPELHAADEQNNPQCSGFKAKRRRIGPAGRGASSLLAVMLSRVACVTGEAPVEEGLPNANWMWELIYPGPIYSRWLPGCQFCRRS
jgi:hypothetical protein